MNATATTQPMLPLGSSVEDSSKITTTATGQPVADVDHSAVERRMAGDRSVRLSTADRYELVRRWLETGRSQNECKSITGIRADRYLPKGGTMNTTTKINKPVPYMINNSALAGRKVACDSSLDGPDFFSTDPFEQAEAATQCASCPIANQCREQGFAYHTAWKAGQNPYDTFGIWGGVWFQPGRRPRPVLHVDDYGTTIAINEPAVAA